MWWFVRSNRGFVAPLLVVKIVLAKYTVLQRYFFVVNSFVDVDPRNSALGNALRLFLGAFPAVYACIW